MLKKIGLGVAIILSCGFVDAATLHVSNNTGQRLIVQFLQGHLGRETWVLKGYISDGETKWFASDFDSIVGVRLVTYKVSPGWVGMIYVKNMMHPQKVVAHKFFNPAIPVYSVGRNVVFDKGNMLKKPYSAR